MIIKPKVFTLQSIFRDSVDRMKDKIAYTYRSCKEQYSYTKVGEIANKLSFYLHSNGINKDDKVAIISENMPQWSISYFSIASMGAVAVPLLTDFSSKEISNILKHSETKFLLISKKVYKKVGKDLDFSGKTLIIDDFSEIGSENTIYSFWDKNIEQGKSFKNPEVKEQDLACIIYTSGTTGRSKGVMLTNENLVWDAFQCTYIEPIDSSYIYLSLLPLAHTYEGTLGLIIGTMQGSTIHYLDRPPTARILLPMMSKVKPTIILTVPLIIEKIFKSAIKPKFTSNFFMKILYNFRPTQILLHKAAGKKLFEMFGGNLHFFGIGGAAVAPEVERFLADAKFPYSCGYGLTETSPMIFGASPGKTGYRSVGPVLKGVEYKIINQNPLTYEGEILVRGKNVMKGYFKDPDTTAEVIDEDGWFHTGDLGVIDKENGYLTLKGRSKNMILGASGENIYPEEIEATINEMDDVVESVVYEHKGKLFAQVYLNMEELSKKFQEMSKSASDYLNEIKKNVNEIVKRNSQIADIKLKDKPFEKTATMKIKRYLVKHEEGKTSEELKKEDESKKNKE